MVWSTWIVLASLLKAIGYNVRNQSYQWGDKKVRKRLVTTRINIFDNSFQFSLQVNKFFAICVGYFIIDEISNTEMNHQG